MFSNIARWLNEPRRPTAGRRSALACEPLEGRCTPAGLFVAGVGGVTQTADPEVSLYATAGPYANQAGVQLEAFAGATGDTRIALGDVNGDGTDDIIAAAGKGGGSAVKIFDGKDALNRTTTVIASFFVYSDQPGVSQAPGFGGGVFVAAADLNGDGFAELITTPGAGGRGHLKVFDFNGGSGAVFLGTSSSFLGSNPTLRASAYTFTDYNGEIRVTTLRAAGTEFVVTASGAGVAGDIRAYQNAYNLGQILDRTPVPASFLKARLVPFGGYTGGLSVVGADSDGNGDDELFVSKNDGAASVAVYSASTVSLAFSQGNVSPVPITTFEAFAGFNGEVRLGAADVDGDGKVEVLTTTGFSGDPKGTPVKAWGRSGTTFSLVRSFYSNPGYQPGAWLGGELTYATDLTSLRTSTGATVTNNGFSATPVFVVFPSDGITAGALVPRETVTGAGLNFENFEASFSFTHQALKEVEVSIQFVPPTGAASKLVLFSGATTQASTPGTFRNITITDDAPGPIPAFAAGADITGGRYQASGGSIASFVRGLAGRAGGFLLEFADLASNANGGSVFAGVAPPRLRLLY